MRGTPCGTRPSISGAETEQGSTPRDVELQKRRAHASRYGQQDQGDKFGIATSRPPVERCTRAGHGFGEPGPGPWFSACPLRRCWLLLRSPRCSLMVFWPRCPLGLLCRVQPCRAKSRHQPCRSNWTCLRPPSSGCGREAVGNNHSSGGEGGRGEASRQCDPVSPSTANPRRPGKGAASPWDRQPWCKSL